MIDFVSDQYQEIVTALEVGLAEFSFSSLVKVLLILGLGFLLRRPIGSLGARLARYWSASIGIQMSEPFAEKIAWLVRVFVVAFSAFVCLQIVHPPGPYAFVIERSIATVCVISLFALLYTTADHIPAILERRGVTPDLLQVTWLGRIVRFAVIVVAAAAALEVWNVDVGPVITGMGIAGAAVALAAQDLIRNLIAGFSNAGERRFLEGDWVRVEGVVEGTVEAIDLRSTLIRRFDRASVHVPNSRLADAPLINFSRRGYRRLEWSISLTYSTPAEILKDICREIETFIAGDDRFVPAANAFLFVKVHSFEDSSIDLIVDCFVNSTLREVYLDARQALALKIKQIVDDNGAQFAFPTRSVYMEREQKKREQA